MGYRHLSNAFLLLPVLQCTLGQRLAWNITLGRKAISPPFYSHLDGSLFVNSDNGRVIALDR
jgi:hypothetical protein